MQLITLLTDFGTRDWFVGTMKGIILRLAPACRVVDLTHEIPPGDVRAGAFALAAAYGYFPKGTVHVAVVDPGVGSSRKAIVIQTTKHCFVGPDNGVLSSAVAREKIKSIRVLENDAFFLKPVSHTFHGRDVFAPVAAHLSRGLSLRQLGPAAKTFVRLELPEPVQTPCQIRGEVLYIDRYGNALTNIDSRSISRGNRMCLNAGSHYCPVADCYEAVPAGKAVAVPGSSGFLEIAINGGSAASRLKLKVGSPVIVRFGRYTR